MVKEKNSNVIGILLGVFVTLTMVLGGYLLYDKVLSKNSRNNDNQMQNNNIDNKRDIKDFFITDKFISQSNIVASDMPAGYVFTESGKFAYYNQDFANHFVESEENRLISYRGNWNIKNNKLLLFISQKEIAVGGNFNEVAPYPVLSNYEIEVKNVDETLEYDVEIINDTSVKLSNSNKEIMLYQLGGVESLVSIIKNIAENGYDNYNKN